MRSVGIQPKFYTRQHADKHDPLKNSWRSDFELIAKKWLLLRFKINYLEFTIDHFENPNCLLMSVESNVSLCSAKIAL